MAAPVFRRSLTPLLGTMALLLFGATFVQQAHRLTSSAEHCGRSLDDATAYVVEHHAVVLERTARRAEARLRDVERRRHSIVMEAPAAPAPDAPRAAELRQRARIALERARLQLEAERLAREAQRIETRMETLVEDEG